MTTPSTGFVIANGSAIVGDLSLNFAALKYNNTFTGSNTFSNGCNVSGLTLNQGNNASTFPTYTGSIYQYDNTLRIVPNIGTYINGYDNVLQFYGCGSGGNVLGMTMDSTGLALNKSYILYCNSFQSNYSTQAVNICTSPNYQTQLNIGNSGVTTFITGSSIQLSGVVQNSGSLYCDIYYPYNNNTNTTMTIGGGGLTATNSLSIGNNACPTTIYGSSVSIPSGINYSSSVNSYYNSNATSLLIYYNDVNYTFYQLSPLNIISSNVQSNSGSSQNPLNFAVYLPQITTINELNYVGNRYIFRRTLGYNVGNINVNSGVIYPHLGNYMLMPGTTGGYQSGLVIPPAGDNTIQSRVTVEYMVIKTTYNNEIGNLVAGSYVWIGLYVT